MANTVTNEHIRVSLDVLTPSQSIVDLAVRFPIYVHTVQSDCEQTDTSAGDYIKNKPNLDLKADKVTNATGGNFASLDSNGNIVDSERSVEKVDNNDTSNLPTLDKVNALLEAMPEPMLFKGSLGTGGTITTLPDVSSLNEGFTYKVITAGTYAGQIAKIGDTFISDGTQWVLIPSGDEPSGTVTSIKIKANTPINIDTDEAIITSGERTISHANSGATAGNYGDSAAQTPAYGATFKVPYVAVNATGHVTEISEHTVKIPASDNTDTHRPIQMNGTEILGNDTTALNLKAGSNVTLTNSSGTVTIASSDSTKADKVSNAVAGNLAELDSNGNLTDSGGKLSSLADNSSVVHTTGAETVGGVKTFSNGLINGSLFFGSPITPISLSGNATWNIDDLKNMMKVVLSSSTNSITLPNGGENTFRFQIIVAQDSTGSRALTISGVSGVNVYNPSEFDFSGGGANQICVCTIIWDGTEYIYECTNYVGGE